MAWGSAWWYGLLAATAWVIRLDAPWTRVSSLDYGTRVSRPGQRGGVDGTAGVLRHQHHTRFIASILARSRAFSQRPSRVFGRVAEGNDYNPFHPSIHFIYICFFFDQPLK